MKKTLYRLGSISKLLPLTLFKTLTKQHTIFPFYHLVSDEELPHIKNLYSVKSTRDFEKDLDFFLKHYNPIDVDTFFNSKLNGYSIKKNSFLLSFDDGLKEIYEVIAPILLRKGIPAIFFLNSGFIDNKDIFYRFKTSLLMERLKVKNLDSHYKKKVFRWFKTHTLSQDYNSFLLSVKYGKRFLLDELATILNLDFDNYLKEKKPYMSSQQINELISKGFYIGAHSVDHPQYSEIDLNTQLNQTKESIQFISKNFKTKKNIFSFPFTDYKVSKSFFDSIFNKDNGFADLTFGCAGLKNDCILKNIQRIPMEVDNFCAQDIVRGEYLYYTIKALVDKNIIYRK